MFAPLRSKSISLFAIRGKRLREVSSVKSGRKYERSEMSLERIPVKSTLPFLFEMAHLMPTPITPIFGQSCNNH